MLILRTRDWLSAYTSLMLREPFVLCYAFKVSVAAVDREWLTKEQGSTIKNGHAHYIVIKLLSNLTLYLTLDPSATYS